jgi:hypothetical protein
MPSTQRRWISILAACSCTFSAAAVVCAAILCLSPKHGIAVMAALSFLGCLVFSIIGIVLGLVALIGCAGRSWLAGLGVLVCAIPLTYCVVLNWDKLRVHEQPGHNQNAPPTPEPARNIGEAAKEKSTGP